MAPEASIYGTFAQSIHYLPPYFSIALGLIVLVLGFIVKRRYLSPLRRFPGPFWASVTRWWLVREIFIGNHEKNMIRLHAKYGPIVRISPFEVAISDPEAVKVIYGHTTGFTKVLLMGRELTSRVNGTGHGIIKVLGILLCLLRSMRKFMPFVVEMWPPRIV
jgi:hypothetical protein